MNYSFNDSFRSFSTNFLLSQNDCLTAGIKFKKNYYSDGDLKPTENLLFTITLFPLTTYEYAADEILEN